MAYKTRVIRKMNVDGEAAADLVVCHPQILYPIVQGITDAEDWGFWQGTALGNLAISEQNNMRDVVNPPDKLAKPALVNAVRGKVEVFSPRAIRTIVQKVPKAEAIDTSRGERIWSRIHAARPFARRLFVAALKTKQSDRCNKDLQKADELSKDRDMVAFLEDPEVPIQLKDELLSYALEDIHGPVLALVYWLFSDHALELLPYIVKEYAHLCRTKDGALQARITTAIPLDYEDILKIIKRLGDMFGKTVMPEFVVDPGLVGGITVRVGDRLLDGSVRGKLESLRKAIAQGESKNQAKTQIQPGTGQFLWRAARRKR